MSRTVFTNTIQRVRAAAKARVSRHSILWAPLQGVYRRLPKRFRPPLVWDVLEAFARSTKDVFFIQVGSNDGITSDPLHRLIRRHRWSGLLVEPVKFIFDRLVANYAGLDRLQFENAAISDRDGTREFLRLRQTDRAPIQMPDQLGSFLPEVILQNTKGVRNLNERLVREQVPCLTLETLLRKHRVTRIDLLHTDTEGFDFEIIKQLDFTRFRPAVILFEHKHLKPRDREACRRHLAGQGYRFVDDPADTAAFLGDLIP